MLFSTSRLYVRKLVLEDLKGFITLQSNPNVLKYCAYTKVPSNQEIEENLIELIDKYEVPDNDFWIWAIVRKEDETFIGTCALVKYEDHSGENTLNGENEIGFRFIEEFWGNGYGAEITEAFLTYIFSTLNKKAVVADVDERNTASVKILERFMILRKSFFNERDQSNDRQYRITKAQFLT